MPFKVMWLRDSAAIGTEDYELLKEATDRAMEGLEQMSTRFGATAVKVVDEMGRPHFLESFRGR